MRDAFRDKLFVVLPPALMAPAVLLLGIPAGLSVLLVALSAVLPALLSLHRVHSTLQQKVQDDFELVRQVIDVIPHPVYVKDADSRYIIVNRAFCDERGLSYNEITRKTTQDIARDRADSLISRQEDLEVLAGKVIRVERHDTHPGHGGERHRMIMKGSCSTNGSHYIVGANFDLSRWWLSERDLQLNLHQERAEYQESLAFMQRIMDLIPHPIQVKDAEGFCVISNQAMVDEQRVSAERGLNTDKALSQRIAEEDQAVLAGTRVLRESRDEDPRNGSERVRIISKGSCVDAQGTPVVVEVHVDLTDLRQSEKNLQNALAEEVALRERTLAFIQSLIDNIPDPVFIKKAGGRYEMINEAFAQYRMVDKLTWKGFDLNQPSYIEGKRETTLTEDDQVLAGLIIEKEDHTHRKQTGEEVFRIISKRRSIFFDGDPVVVGVERHISKWRIAERELNAALERETQQRLRTERFVQDLIDVMPDPVYVKNAAGQYRIVNEAFARIQRQARHEIIGRTIRELDSNPENSITTEIEDAKVIHGASVYKEQRTLLPVSGEEAFRIICKRRCVDVDGEPVVVGIHHYITEWRKAERELKRMAEEDVLTGLSNRRHFSIEARRAIDQAHRHNESLSILIMDLDHFKQVNDRFGHNVGDEVLRAISQRMQEAFRKSDLPGRWGGEEFIALLPHTPVDTAYKVGERLRLNVANAEITTSAGAVPLTLSGGIAQRQDGDTLESLIARADAALYRAKSGGRNCIVVAQHEQFTSVPNRSANAE